MKGRNNMSEAKEKREYEKFLEELDEIVDTASTVPFANKKMIDADQIHELVDRVRLNIPDEIKRANDMAREKEAILSDANKEADNIISQARQQADELLKEAKAQADQLVSQQEIIGRANEYAKAQAQRADEEAAAILNQAREKEIAIREAMVENINSALSEASAVLQKNLDAVNSTKEAILRIGQ